MTKNIKDYLHLYIGCNIAIAEERFNSPGLRLIGISDLGCQVRDESIKLSFYVNLEDCKLVLRPLSNMTEEEIKELIKFDKLNQMYANVAFRMVIGYKDIATAIEIDYTIVEEDIVLPQTWRLDFFAMNAHDFAWCLRKGFDLFGLIQDGIAIDATKVQSKSKTI